MESNERIILVPGGAHELGKGLGRHLSTEGHGAIFIHIEPLKNLLNMKQNGYGSIINIIIADYI